MTKMTSVLFLTLLTVISVVKGMAVNSPSSPAAQYSGSNTDSVRPGHGKPLGQRDHVLTAPIDPVFKKTTLTGEFWSEGAAFGDFNQDGSNDIASGPYWYEGPDFSKRHAFRPAEDVQFFRITADMKHDGHPEQLVYSDSFFAFVHDINGDGWPDILSIGLPGKEAFWYENPGKAGLAATTTWARHVAFDSVTSESPTFVDLLNNGRPVILCMSGDFAGYVTPDWSHPDQKWDFHPVSAPIPALRDFRQKYGKPFTYTHGLGCGDVNGDGRPDVMGPKGWWEQPARLDGEPAWRFHRWTFLLHEPSKAPISTVHDLWPYSLGGAQIWTYDVNGDGLPDIISSLAAHGYGLAWFEQLQAQDADADIQFKTHVIMNKEPSENAYGIHFSQLHAVDLVDMDGDGLKDIITGKRFRAHGRYGDEDPNGPAVLYWFKLVREVGGQVKFVPHLVDNDSGVGTQVMAGNIDGTGRSGIVVGNKKGTFVFLQETETKGSAENTESTSVVSQR